MTMKENSLILIIFLIILSSCEKNQDYSPPYIGEYKGIRYNTNCHLSPSGPDIMSCNTDTSIKVIYVYSAPCNQCIALIYDTVVIENNIYINIDTISLAEDGSFDSRGGYVGHSYYSLYMVNFLNDSLIIRKYHAGASHSSDYEFFGKRIIK